MTCAGAGSIDVDGYTNEQVSTSTVMLTRVVTVRCDRCGGDGVWKFHGDGHDRSNRCELCGGTGRRAITPAGPELKQREGANSPDNNLWGARGSYHELERQLHELAGIDSGAAALVHRALVDGREQWTAADNLRLTAAVTWLAYRMPWTIEVPPGVSAAEKRLREHGTGVRGRWANNGALKKRDGEIRKHSRDGRSQQWIAREYGLTPARISQLLKGAT